MSASNIIRVVQLTMLTAVSAFFILVTMYGHWRESPPPKTDIDTVSKQIISAMQNQFDTGEGTKDYRLQVATGPLNLINVTGTGTEYQGLAHVTTQKGNDVSLGLTVYADTTGSWIYQTDPSSLTKLTTQAEKDKSGW